MAKRVDYIAMAEMLDSGHSDAEIVKFLGCSLISVYRFALSTKRREPVWAASTGRPLPPHRKVSYDAEKVELIRLQIAAGKYPFSAERIADAMIGYIGRRS